MLIFENQIELNNYLNPLRKEGFSIGFVPTMGALHQGHLSLLRKSVKHNDITIISIFVNPTQFNNKEDLEKYPRNLEQDTAKIKSVNKNIIIYAPSVEDIYNQNIASEPFDFDGLEHQMEGKFRPGHFDGVGTIVKKLFEIVRPKNTYFGEKDYQQTLIVKKLISKHQIRVKLHVCPTLREESGLAMSSRNERLTPEERDRAKIIYQTLLEAKKIFTEHDHTKAYEYVKEVFQQEPLFELEYFSIADSSTLIEISKKLKTKRYRAFIAVFVRNIRLIDTISFY
ncbi:MAG: pantoate--beta-alanine ligase [Bacteroidota bacterium]|nr:pantoate--beta-alanine ligase [Bacteroidota bacterium]